MKKAKKLLSVFLAALMVLTALSGVMMASAATNDEAAAAAAAFNEKAAAVDHSGVYENMSANAAQTTKDTLNGLLGPILTAINVPEKIYTDATVTAVWKLLNVDLLGTNVATVASNISDDYPEAKAYVASLSSWDELDTSKVVWGITPGDREAFCQAVNESSGNVTNVLNLVVLLGPTMAPGVLEAITNFFESLHIGTVPMLAMNTELYTVADALTRAIDALVANPITYLCDVLPDVANAYGELVVKLEPVLGLVGDLEIPADFSALVQTIGGAIGFEFPEFDVDYLITMGEAAVVESGATGGYRMAINGNQGMVFAALMNYVGETLKTPANQVALSKLIADQIGAGYGDEVGAIVEASLNGDALSIADASVALCESIAENLGIKAEAEQSGILGFFAKVMDFFNRIARMIVDLFKSFGA
ncbi:MAG TPA: hypothetical protein IAD07_00610 [Candidatus Fimivicinus intestinavium]|nr:hypothetical protein [Candidatus Fimivicinus intestinavium]